MKIKYEFGHENKFAFGKRGQALSRFLSLPVRRWWFSKKGAYDESACEGPLQKLIHNYYAVVILLTTKNHYKKCIFIPDYSFLESEKRFPV